MWRRRSSTAEEIIIIVMTALEEEERSLALFLGHDDGARRAYNKRLQLVHVIRWDRKITSFSKLSSMGH